jgi:long-chain fatty acid transport protein
MKSKLLVVVLSIFLLSVEILPNGLSLNSIGPEALGMGGAFVGYANDYTAIYWNPAGLTQMQKNFVGIFTTDIVPMGTYQVALAGGSFSTKEKVNNYISPNLIGYYHFEAAKNLTIAVGFYVPAGIGAEWKGSELTGFANGVNLAWMSKVSVINISPSVAYKINDKISVGVALNIYRGMFYLNNPYIITSPINTAVQYSESSNGWGVGVTAGVLYKPIDKLSIGVSFRSKTTVKMNGSASNPAMAFIMPGASSTSDFSRNVAWPMWIAGGVAYHATDKLVITADVQWSQWSKSENQFVTNFKNPVWAAATAATNANVMVLNWKDVTQIRVGGEYTLSPSVILRAGYYNDPAPAPDQTYNILFPSITFNTATIGGSYLISNFTIDAGIEYLFGKNRVITTNTMPGTYGMNILAWSLGVGYAF